MIPGQLTQREMPVEFMPVHNARQTTEINVKNGITTLKVCRTSYSAQDCIEMALNPKSCDSMAHTKNKLTKEVKQ